MRRVDSEYMYLYSSRRIRNSLQPSVAEFIHLRVLIAITVLYVTMDLLINKGLPEVCYLLQVQVQVLE
jgi:hypothetical protein